MAKVGDRVGSRYVVAEVSNRGLPTKYYDIQDKRYIYTQYGALVRDEKVSGHWRLTKQGKYKRIKTYTRKVRR